MDKIKEYRLIILKLLSESGIDGKDEMVAILSILGDNLSAITEMMLMMWKFKPSQRQIFYLAKFISEKYHTVQ